MPRGVTRRGWSRTVNRKPEFFFKYCGEFFEACRTAYDINSRNFITLEKTFGDSCHFFDGCLDNRKNFIFFFRSGFEYLSFFIRNLIMTGNSHGHVTSTGCLIVRVDDFAVFENTDTGSTTADIDNSTISNLEDGRSSSRLVHDIRYFKTGSLKDIADTLDAAFRNSRRDCSGSIEQFCSEFFFELLFQFSYKLDDS